MARHYTYSKGIVYKEVLHDAIGLSSPNPQTIASQAQLIAGAKGVGIQFTGATITTRSSVLTVTVSMDGGSTYQAYSRLVSNLANTNAQGLTRVASVTRAATGTDIF